MKRVQSEAVQNQSVWAATAKMPAYAALKSNVQADVCIVGGGIAGLTTGYLLVQEGKSVVLLDDGPLAGGMTEVTTAHLANALDARYVEIARLHGDEGAALAARSHTAAIDRIEAIIAKEKIHCDFERLDGYLFLGEDDPEELLDEELAAARRAGLVGVEKIERAPLKSFDTGPCLRFPDQAQFHPLKYLAGLARAIRRAGGRIFTQTHADQITGGTPATIAAGRHLVTANAVVVATNTPINDLVAIHTKQAPYMTYVIGVRIPHGAVTRALYWDTEQPYHYVRLQNGNKHDRGHDLLIVGGEDHRTGQADDTQERHGRLEDWARARFSMIEEVQFAWAGQVMETVDGLAYIGRNPLDYDNVFIVTGDCGMGMTHGTIAGILLTDLILGRENQWASLYDPSRITPGAVAAFTSEGLNTAVQYADWLTEGDVASVRQIKRDAGAVLRRGLSKVAVYRDGKGKLHELSAVCTHLGCLVHWNPTEKTWDCPCHGSRFDKLGKVINGPANQNLCSSDDG